MQNKGIIKFATAVLSVLSLYALSFTFFANKVEDDAKAYANGDPAKERSYLDSISSQPVYPIFGHTYQYVKEREIALGLDLKGGMNVTMEIDLSALLKSLANNPTDANFNQALENAQEKLKTNSKEGLVSLFVSEFEKLSPNVKLASFYSTKDNSSDLKIDDSNAKVKTYLEKQATSAIERSFNILRTRIDKFGVTQPNIQLQEGSNRILVELPGVTDQERVRKLLQGSAKLEFYETFDNHEIFPLIQNINNILAAKQPKEATKKAEATTTAVDTTKGAKPALLSAKKDSTSKDSSENMAALAKANPLFSVLSPATYQGANGEQGLRPGPVVGYVALKDTAKVNEYLREPEIKAVIPPNVKLMWGVKSISKDAKVYELYAIKGSGINNGAVLEGDVISNAREDFDQKGNPEVTMSMNSTGAREWKRITAAAAGDPRNEDDNKCIAIVLDDMVYTAPRVGGEIPNGVSSISGNFTVEETKDLANVLKAGKLPAPAKIVGEYVVGPTLGKESIEKGVISSVAGLIVVLLFMVFYYNRSGMIANFALLFNMFFLVGIMASLGAVWTLPGIAGLVLTIGMAVDANVLIYERIKEELELGKNLKTAVVDGFKNSYSAILDSQITTLIVGIILLITGTGPIYGFAVTLVIGIFLSIFTAIFITRIVIDNRLEKGKDLPLYTSFTKNLFKGSPIDFVKDRKKYYIISSVIIIAGLASMLIKGFSYGVDFQGGRTYVVDFNKEISTIDVREALTKSFENDAPEVKSYGSGVRITTAYLIEDNSDQAEKTVATKLNDGLKTLNTPYEIKDAQKVGPTVANDIKVSAIWSVLAAIAGIFLYVYIRFRKVSFGIATIIALLHDVLIVLAIFSIFDGILPFSLDIDQTFIAAILTVAGYSINDTVVIFDRVREYLSDERNRNQNMATIINNALNSTLSRTVVTGMSTIFVLIILFIFGGEILRGFSFAMLIGIIVGTYSSLFVATPVVVEFIRGKKSAENK
ncbi:protein-export membrane protein SecD [Pseudopedobacter saltans DSM 12145]|uniref:Multifunctional fusion protein n=1 Tax=Pseudopedobacter saltans (strain ATCC 51119 / DSM 12145 / JCM 21818 / CCUG 39354 / LMG 10337 / NBRC 100064 / NCIMB 13643) TaxID=762903 RepID=F0SAH8_PSESL|nr:protein translocase subunit SecDF [Pseudopedobacter saltans]ADY52598.1 protein-export membrane protein SecD [Pseudopedobacter saltans DSM 12145]